MDVPMSANTTAQQRKAPRLPPRTLIRRRAVDSVTLDRPPLYAALRGAVSGFRGRSEFVQVLAGSPDRRRPCTPPPSRRSPRGRAGGWPRAGPGALHRLFAEPAVGGSRCASPQARRPGDLRVVVRRPTKLPRTLGAPALFAASYGNVGSSIYYALGVTAAFALGLTPLALLLAGCIFVTTALNYAEGTAAIPHAGGSSSFARRAFNDPIGFLVGWVQLLNYMATVSISSYFAISYLGVFGKYVPLFQQLKMNETWHVGATVVMIAILIVINIVGIQESSALNLVLALVDLVTQFALVILGVFLLLNFRTVIANLHWGVAPTWGNFLASISIAMVTYTGIENISNLSEEAKNPGRSVPRATYAVIG